MLASLGDCVICIHISYLKQEVQNMWLSLDLTPELSKLQLCQPALSTLYTCWSLFLECPSPTPSEPGQIPFIFQLLAKVSPLPWNLLLHSQA